MKFKIPALFLIVLFSSVFISAQKPFRAPASPSIVPPPGNMSLLPGYEHRRLQGIDSRVGEISKKDGLVIRYDIGAMAGDRAATQLRESKERLVWSKGIKVNGNDLQIVYFENGKIFATFKPGQANFFADTKDQQEVAEFLMMIMTYVGRDNLSSSATNPQS